MIPILYEPSERRFLTNGIGRLSDCIRCVCTEERNGVYEVEFDYPADGEHYSDIKLGRIIAVTHDDTGDIQPFDIYAKSAPIDGVVTFNAHHVSYRLSDIVCMPFEAASCADAISKLAANSANANPFNFWTDKATGGNFKLEAPKNVRNILGGESGSLLDVYGKGDYQFDKFNVRLYANRGVDTGVSIRYGKNMTDLTFKENASDVYNAVVPYWLDSQTGALVVLPEKVLVFSGATPQVAYLTDEDLLVIRTETGEPIEVAYRMVDAVPMDLSSEFEEQPTVAELREAATAKFQSSYAWLPSQTVEVDFVQLWQTEEYKDYAPLQRVRLCDTVSVYYPKLGVEAVKEKVIKTVYNVLLDRYDSIELGTPQTTLAQSMTGTIETMMQDRPTVSFMEKAIQYASEMITGNHGGYVVLKENVNGQPEELLILDNEDINQAVDVWRWNAGGLGHSHNGYNGPYDDVAITMDGAINAAAITVGTMLANHIKGGTLTLGGYDNQNGIFRLESASGFTVGLLDNTGIVYTSEETFHRTNYHPQFRRSTLFDSGQVGFRVQQITNGSGDAVTMDPEILGSISPELTSLDITFDTNNSMNTALGLDYGAVSLIAKTQNGSNEFKVGVGSAGDKYVESSSDVYMENHALWFGNYFAIGYPSGLYNYAIGRHDGSSIKSGLAFRQSGNNNVVGIYVYNTSLTVGTGGTKSKLFETDKEERAMYCYEMPTPIFGDIGCGATDETGTCVVTIDKMFSDGSNTDIEYQVFLQKENQGDLWVAEKTPTFFVVKGTPELSFSWEIKAKQRNFEGLRMEIENTETPYMDWLNDEPDYLEEGSELFMDFLSEFN